MSIPPFSQVQADRPCGFSVGNVVKLRSPVPSDLLVAAGHEARITAMDADGYTIEFANHPEVTKVDQKFACRQLRPVISTQIAYWLTCRPAKSQWVYRSGFTIWRKVGNPADGRCPRLVFLLPIGLSVGQHY